MSSDVIKTTKAELLQEIEHLDHRNTELAQENRQLRRMVEQYRRKAEEGERRH